MRFGHDLCHKKETFHVALAGQNVQGLVLPFQIPISREFGWLSPKPHKQKQPEINLNAEISPPSSICAQTFGVKELLRILLEPRQHRFQQGLKAEVRVLDAYSLFRCEQSATSSACIGRRISHDGFPRRLPVLRGTQHNC